MTQAAMAPTKAVSFASRLSRPAPAAPTGDPETIVAAPVEDAGTSAKRQQHSAEDLSALKDWQAQSAGQDGRDEEEMSEVWDGGGGMEHEIFGERRPTQSRLPPIKDHVAEPGEFRMERIPQQEIGDYTGKAWRNAITGKVHLHKVPRSTDFSVVDLFNRPDLFGTMTTLTRDPYLFKPVPLAYRTWIFHYCFMHGGSVPCDATDDSATFKYVLGQKCIDAQISAGRWASVLRYGPMAFLSCLTCDFFFVGFACVVTMLTLIISLYTNSPSQYRKTRLATFLPRLGFMGYVVVMIATSSDMIALLGSLLSLCLVIADFIQGDGSVLISYRFHCTYSVLKSLPHRVFICQRHGAAGLDMMFGSRGEVSETVSGMGKWDKNKVLLCDFKGLLMELRPMTYHDWAAVAEDYIESEGIKIPRFVSIGLFSKETPTLAKLESELNNAALAQLQKAKQFKLTGQESADGQAGESDVTVTELT